MCIGDSEVINIENFYLILQITIQDPIFRLEKKARYA